MHDYLKLISGFLQKEESCFLPGIGVLKFERQPAFEKDNQIQPPSSRLVLDPLSTDARHHMLDKIKSHFSLSGEAAKQKWDDALEEIKTQKKPVVIPAIGELVPEEQGAFVCKAYPLENIYAPILWRENPSAPKLTPPLPPEDKPVNSNRKLPILLPLILLAVIALGYFGYRYLFNPPAKTIKEDSTVTPVERTGPPISSTPTTDTVNAREATLKGTQTTDSIHFAVIYIVYRNRQSAVKHYKRMRNWGHDVSLYTPDSGSFMVGYPFYELRKDTTKRLEEIQDTYGGHPFIIYPEK